MLWMKRSKDARVPASASVPIAVQTSVSRARCTASFNARDATDAENAVPFRIPRCSLDERGRGVMLCNSRAFRDEQISRAPKVAGPSKTRIDGLPVNAPAIYDSGERSRIHRHKRKASQNSIEQHTSRSRYTSAHRNHWCDVRAKKFVHLLD